MRQSIEETTKPGLLWLALLPSVWGCEGEGSGGDGGSGGDNGDSDDDDGDGSGSGSDGSGDGGDGNDDDNDDDGNDGEEKDPVKLKNALKAERQRARKLEREAKALRKFKETKEGETLSDIDKANKKATDATAKTTRLAERLLTQSLNNAIIAEATKLGFNDVDDAIALVNRDDIDAEQDEDDPAEVTIDKKTVARAVKALADKKKHLLKPKDGEGGGGGTGRTGSRFNGSRDGGDDKRTAQEKLMEKYPALRG